MDFSPKRKRSETAFSAQPSDRVFCVVVVVVVCLFFFFFLQSLTDNQLDGSSTLTLSVVVQHFVGARKKNRLVFKC